MTTFGFPPTSSTLASKSPIVLLTLSLPGNTLNGPYNRILLPSLMTVYDWYTFPPAFSTLTLSSSLSGQWSQLIYMILEPFCWLMMALLSPTLPTYTFLFITTQTNAQLPDLSTIIFPFSVFFTFSCLYMFSQWINALNSACLGLLGYYFIITK